MQKPNEILISKSNLWQNKPHGRRCYGPNLCLKSAIDLVLPRDWLANVHVVGYESLAGATGS